MARLRGSLHLLVLTGLFLFSFVFFLYFTFPYGVLKEAITSELNRTSEVNLRIGKLRPKFPLGLVAEDVVVFTEKGKKDLRIHRAAVSLSILHLFLGKAHADIDLGSKNGGELELGMSFGLFSLLGSGTPIPGITLESDKFTIDGALDFLLSSLGASPGVSPLLGPLLNQIKLTGQLDGSADIDLDLADLKSSEGTLVLKLNNGQLVIDDPALNIAPQIFNKFDIQAKMNAGELVIDKKSGLKTQEMQVDVNGKVGFRKVLAASQLNVDINVVLQDGLKENFALVVELAMGGKDGRGRIQLAGTLGSPLVNKL